MALGLRLLVMAVAFGHTPFDVAEHFRLTGEAVLRQQDPLLTLPRYQWNFLPAMPYVHALELSTGLPWELVGKLCRCSPTWRPRSWSARCPPRSGRPGSAGSTRCTRRAVPAMVSYRSLAGSWGWTGLGRLHGGVGYGYAGPRAVFFYQPSSRPRPPPATACSSTGPCWSSPPPWRPCPGSACVAAIVGGC